MTIVDNTTKLINNTYIFFNPLPSSMMFSSEPPLSSKPPLILVTIVYMITKQNTNLVYTVPP